MMWWGWLVNGTTRSLDVQRPGLTVRSSIVLVPFEFEHDTQFTRTVRRLLSFGVDLEALWAKLFLGQLQIKPMLAASLRQLVDRLDLRGVGNDLVKDEDGEYWAVDVNLAAGYRNSGLEPALTESIIAGLPSG